MYVTHVLSFMGEVVGVVWRIGSPVQSGGDVTDPVVWPTLNGSQVPYKQVIFMLALKTNKLLRYIVPFIFLLSLIWKYRY